MADSDLIVQENIATCVVSNEYVGEIRYEVVCFNDLAMDDFKGMIKLQKETENDEFINKTISPFAVYIDSHQLATKNFKFSCFFLAYIMETHFSHTKFRIVGYGENQCAANSEIC